MDKKIRSTLNTYIENYYGKNRLKVPKFHPYKCFKEGDNLLALSKCAEVSTDLLVKAVNHLSFIGRLYFKE